MRRHFIHLHGTAQLRRACPSTLPAENYSLVPWRSGSLAKTGGHCLAEPNNIAEPSSRWSGGSQKWHARYHQTLRGWIGASKRPWTGTAGCLKWVIFFCDRLWRPESTTSSPLRKAKLPNWESRNVEECKQWPLETIKETDRPRTVWEGLNPCMFSLCTTDLQRKAPETEFQSLRFGNNLFEGDESSLPSLRHVLLLGCILAQALWPFCLYFLFYFYFLR